MQTFVWLLVIVACSYGLIAKANQEEQTNASRIKILIPQSINFDQITQGLDVKDQIEDKLDLVGQSSNQRQNSWARNPKIKQYISNIKKFTQLRLTEDFAVTVGSVKSGPLSIKQKSLIETPEVFHSKEQQDMKSTKGYGIRFKLDL